MPDRALIPAIRIAPARDAHLWLSAFEASAARSATLLLLGIRDLKQINDLHGRDIGNAVINAVGKRIAEAAGTMEGIVMVARMPGREFLVITGHPNGKGVSDAAARKFLTAVSGNVGPQDVEIHISARIGMASAVPGQSGTILLQRAQSALAAAYTRKGRKYALAAPLTGENMVANASLDRDLRGAIENGQIALLLQPQFSVIDGRLAGAEVLARWAHPGFGELGASQLFAAADRCDLREELSHLVQREAIAIAAKWPAQLKPLRLSINLGAGELTDDYARHLFHMLATAGFPAEQLTLELTEESLVRDIDVASSQLQTLRNRGIRIALDDFGTGYSSLSYLKRLPIDYLKLDKGIVPDIDGQGKDRIIVRAIIAMGHALDLKIIAEGVERQAELDVLKAEGCDYFQGFLRSQPLSPDEFALFALREAQAGPNV
jgi:diguanylate cyclase (GGDEF)-like protein